MSVNVIILPSENLKCGLYFQYIKTRIAQVNKCEIIGEVALIALKYGGESVFNIVMPER